MRYIKAGPIGACFGFVKKTTAKQLTLLGLVGLMACSIFVGSGIGLLIANNSTYAAVKFTPQQEVESLSYYTALTNCVSNGMYGDITGKTTTDKTKDVNVGDWFNQSGLFAPLHQFDVYTGSYSTKTENCSDIMSAALSLWGLGSASGHEQFLTDMGYTWKSSSQTWHGTSDGTTRLKDFFDAVKKDVYPDLSGNPSTAVPKLSAEAQYDLDFGLFTASPCSAKNLGTFNSSLKTSNPGVYSAVKNSTSESASDAGISGLTSGEVQFQEVDIIAKDGDTSTTATAYAYRSGTTTSGVVNNKATGETSAGRDVATQEYLTTNSSTAPTVTCTDLATKVGKDADALAKAAATTGTGVSGITGGGGQGKDLNPQCPDGSTSSDCTATPAKPTCTIPNIGWIVCPVMNFMGSLADGMYNVLQNFLQVPPLSQSFTVMDSTGTTTTIKSTDGSAAASPEYSAWKIMQALANVVLVIVFLIIIFSQLTGMGVSNYGVKKMLPRIVIAAIAMNLSFFICSIMIDLSNILGASLKGLFEGVATQITQNTIVPTGGVADGTTGWADAVGVILAVPALGAAAYFGLSMVGTLVVAAILALLVILLILIGRQVIILLFVVLAPLAFAAYILPNTQKLFKQWWNILFAMLLLYPIVGLVYGASELASVIMKYSFTSGEVQVGDSTTLIAGTGTSGWLGEVMASAVLVLPLFAVPFILKGALSAVPMVGQFAQKWGNRATGNLANKAKQSTQGSVLGRSAAIRRNAREQYRTRRFAERVGKGGLTGAIAGGLGVTKAQKAAKQAVARTAYSASQKAEAEEVHAALQQMTSESLHASDSEAYATEQFKNALVAGDSVKAKAAYSLLYSQGQPGVEAARAQIEAHGFDHAETAAALREHILANHSDVKGKDVRTMRFADSGMVPNQAALEKGIPSLTDAEVATQTPQSLKEAISSGLIDQERAQRILASPMISSGLKETQRGMLQQLAGTASTGSSQGGQSPALTGGDGGSRPTVAEFAPTMVDGLKSDPNYGVSYIQHKGGVENMHSDDLKIFAQAYTGTPTATASAHELLIRGAAPDKNIISDADVIHLANSNGNGNADLGRAAKDEARRRGLST